MLFLFEINNMFQDCHCSYTIQDYLLDIGFDKYNILKNI